MIQWAQKLLGLSPNCAGSHRGMALWPPLTAITIFWVGSVCVSTSLNAAASCFLLLLLLWGQWCRCRNDISRANRSVFCYTPPLSPRLRLLDHAFHNKSYCILPGHACHGTLLWVQSNVITEVWSLFGYLYTYFRYAGNIPMFLFFSLQFNASRKWVFEILWSLTLNGNADIFIYPKITAAKRRIYFRPCPLSTSHRTCDERCLGLTAMELIYFFMSRR